MSAILPKKCGSDNQSIVEIDARFRADMLYSVLPVCTEIIISETVGFLVNNGF